MIQADPVHPSRDRVLGFVLIFSDITDRKAAEIARSQFQEGIVQSDRISSSCWISRPTRLPEPAVVGDRERPARGARNHLWRGNRPDRRDAGEHPQFDAAHCRSAGASDLACVPDVGRRPAERLKRKVWPTTYSTAATVPDPCGTAASTAQERSIFMENAIAPSSTTACRSGASAPASSSALR